LAAIVAKFAVKRNFVTQSQVLRAVIVKAARSA